MTNHRGARARGHLLHGVLTVLGLAAGLAVVYALYFLMVYSTVSP